MQTHFFLYFRQSVFLRKAHFAASPHPARYFCEPFPFSSPVGPQETSGLLPATRSLMASLKTNLPLNPQPPCSGWTVKEVTTLIEIVFDLYILLEGAR